MRTIEVDSGMSAKIKSGKTSFYTNEIPPAFSSITPGEWFSIINNKQTWLCYGNPFVKDVPMLWVLSEQIVEPRQYIQKKIELAFKRRQGFYQNQGMRLVYGQSDHLPGVIIDTYLDHVLIQINTAGMDKYRDDIKQSMQELYPQKKCYFLDRKKYRESEGLPEFDKQWSDEEEITIVDSGLTYKLPMGRMQKVGFYFDHRDNRSKFENYLQNDYLSKNTALDLFCYLGSWGLQAARAGCKSVDFVDQANFSEIVSNNLKNVNPKADFKFHHEDVFKFLDNAIVSKRKWDVVICDPPAFCKSAKQKQQALSGYRKLYNKIFKLLEQDSTLVVASCTKYVNLEELTSIVEVEAKQCGRNVLLRDIGLQAIDHPFTSLKDNANYIKYALYRVE
tara:strand:+ start:12469 stop:13641 length:1173 start_codon:yes stop_codon:yes gene_type:complete